MKKIINVPFISQMPELPRGCEVTSLAMLLNYYEVDIDKLTLAKEIKRDKTPYKKENGKVYFGNPYKGFVGDMYSFDNPGLGVYYPAILDLANKYSNNRAINITRKNFDIILKYLSNNTPIWIITNDTFKELSNEHWELWITPSGPLNITMREHSVVLIGYDDDYIYFNDPLENYKESKYDIKNFKKAWEQMGSQAIIIKEI
ncbi:C39 family peptidase [Clostridium sp. D2Q-11]|uniref:C39 family peptidase n=1 Tax=Anaeromonas frigoriresistens TaxID=2683708 RepID=A0A942V290_9FIRM|nr:C39 family peptidase [Anaeromonas frigoriresistens]MBS4538652.1 C39 family peptidase [Anaeromonas frigoriresistens]